jgi:hypothetical protein
MRWAQSLNARSIARFISSNVEIGELLLDGQAFLEPCDRGQKAPRMIA